MAYQRERDATADSQWQQQFNLSRAKASSSGGGSSRLSSGSSKSSSGSKLGKGSNVDEIYSRIHGSMPEGLTDNMGGRIKYEKWESSASKELQALYEAGTISKTELAELITKLGLSY